MTKRPQPKRVIVLRETAAEPMKRLTVDVPESLHRKIKGKCGREGRMIADVVREDLERFAQD